MVGSEEKKVIIKNFLRGGSLMTSHYDHYIKETEGPMGILMRNEEVIRERLEELTKFYEKNKDN